MLFSDLAKYISAVQEVETDNLLKPVHRCSAVLLTHDVKMK